MKKVGIIIGIVVGTLAALYIAGFVLGHFFFYPHTTVNGVDVSYQKADEAQEDIIPDNSEFAIKEIDGTTEKINLSDIDYSIELKDSTRKLLRSQEHIAWPATFFRNTEMTDEYVVTFNEDKLDESLNALDAFNEEKLIKPQDAYVGPGEDGQYVIVPEVVGNLLNKENTTKEVQRAVKGASYEINLEDERLL